MYRLTRIDPGFDPAHLGIVSLSLPESRYESPEDWGGFFRRLSDRVRSLPSTQSVALASGLVPGARRFDGLVIEGSADTIDEPPRMPEMIAVSPEYFPTIGIPIIRGRHFVPEDRAGSGSVAVINAAFADRYWPGGEALGRRFRFGESGEWMTVVGIAGSAATRRTLQTLPAAMQFYTLHDDAFPRASLVIRAERDMSSVLTAVRELVRELDADLPIGTATSVDQILNDAIARQRFTTTLFTVFAGLALVLATVGVYGVIALSVSQRVNELGVRIALGAGDRHIMRSVFAGGLAPVVLGAVLGIIGAFVLTPQLGHLVFGLDMPDAGISLAVLGLFGAVSALACWIPARRAMRVDPVVALRAD